MADSKTKKKGINSKKKTAKKLKKKYALRRLCAFYIVLAFVWWFNNYTLIIRQTSVSSPTIAEPVRIAVLSDYHVHKGSIPSGNILKKIETIQPDAVFVLGDMYSRTSNQEEQDMAKKLIVNMAEDYPTYFVPGDHDTSKDFSNALAASGVHVMSYAEETVTIKGNSFHIMGIDNVYYTPTFDLKTELSLDDNSFNVLLAHIPNYEKFAAFGAELTLCADTHGGIMRIPYIGPVYDSASNSFLPQLTGVETYDKGWFDYDGGSMFITSGIGDSPVPLRFFNRPEIVSIDILPLSTT